MECRILLPWGGSRPDLTFEAAYVYFILQLLPYQKQLIKDIYNIYKYTTFTFQSPLHYSAAATHGAMCLELLINEGANVNLQSRDGRTPLHMTALHGRSTRAQSLIQNGMLLYLMPIIKKKMYASS